MLAIVLADNQAGRKKSIDHFGGRAEFIQNVAPSRWCEPDTETFGGGPVNATFSQVVDGRGIVLEFILKVLVDSLCQIKQFIKSLRRSLPLLVGNLDANNASQTLDGIDKAHVVVIHEETQSSAVCATAEAVVKALGRANGEGGGFLVVEWANSLIFTARFLELYAPTEDLDDIRTRNQVINKMLRYAAAHA
jgi:hypothetical protein